MTDRRTFLLGAASLPLATVVPAVARAATGAEFDIFAIAGQSNGTGRGDLALSPAVSGGHLECFVPPLVNKIPTGDPYLKLLDDPVQQTCQQAVVQKGSMWPAFANEYGALTGRRVVICGGCRDGQGLLNAWRLDFPYVTRLGEKVGHAKRLLGQTGGTGILRGVIWVGGEQDAKEAKTHDEWRDAFVLLLQRFRVAMAEPTLPMFCVSLDAWGTPGQYVTEFAEIRRAQRSACALSTGLAMVTDFRDYAGQGWMKDPYAHLDQRALNATGAEAALGVAANVF